MVNFMHRILSRFHPVVLKTNGRVVVVIRGHVFEGDSCEEEVRHRIAGEAEAVRAELREGMGDDIRGALTSANP